VQHGFRSRHDDDQVGVHERRVDAERHGASAAELDQVVALDVMNLDVAVKASREVRRDERLELIVPGAAGKAARNEQRLVAGRDAQPLELPDRRRDRGLPRVPLRSRQRQVRWLDDDRRPHAARQEGFERLTCEREAQRVPHRRADIRDRIPRRRRPEHE
jgi:hypothetical protein